MLLENKLIHYHSLPVCLLPLPLPQFVNQSSRQLQQDPFSLAQSLFVGIQTVVGDHCQNSRPRLISFSILRLANRQAVVQCMADLISDKDVKSLRILKKRGFLRSAHCSVLALDALFWHWKDEMLAKADQYLTLSANEQQLLEDTPLEEILVDNPYAELQIMMSVLGVKLGRQIRGLGDGRLREIGTSSNVRHMEKELKEERAVRKEAHAVRIEIEQKMKNKLKVVGQQFNSTM